MSPFWYHFTSGSVGFPRQIESIQQNKTCKSRASPATKRPQWCRSISQCRRTVPARMSLIPNLYQGPPSLGVFRFYGPRVSLCSRSWSPQPPRPRPRQQLPACRPPPPWLRPRRRPRRGRSPGAGPWDFWHGAGGVSGCQAPEVWQLELLTPRTGWEGLKPSAVVGALQVPRDLKSLEMCWEVLRNTVTPWGQTAKGPTIARELLYWSLVSKLPQEVWAKHSKK